MNELASAFLVERTRENSFAVDGVFYFL